MFVFAALVWTLWCGAAPSAFAQTPPADVYRIIVNPKNPRVSIDRELAAQTFLKKVATWSHGGVIRPVDLALDSPIRRKFSEEVLRRSVSAVRSYWLQIVFAGRGVPPPELKSDEEVVSYVLREPGAIGYVSTRADLQGARVLVVE
jgi:ABC-type phosphate transport system substrate-binding protein